MKNCSDVAVDNSFFQHQSTLASRKESNSLSVTVCFICVISTCERPNLSVTKTNKQANKKVVHAQGSKIKLSKSMHCGCKKRLYIKKGSKMIRIV